MIPGNVYPQFFGLSKLPFRLRPDADFLYPGADYLRTRTKLLAGLKERTRVLLLLGNPGVGKTTLLDDVRNILGADCVPCRINQPQMSAAELLEALLLQLGSALPEGNNGRPRSYAELADGIDAIGTRAVNPLMMVDDAHQLAPATTMAFTEILARAPNIKIVLSGRSGAGLEENAVRFLAGQTPQLVRMSPLGQAETRAYIDHRLGVAGSRNRDLIADDAYPVIFQHTGGVPRLTNLLCDGALHAACLRASGQVGTAEVMLATQDARWPEAVARDRAVAGTREAAQREAVEEAPMAAAAAQLVVSAGREQVSTWPLRPGRVTIGRASDNEFRLDTRFVSRHHCQVTTVGSVSTIEDLGSINGICVNGQMVKRHVLCHADAVQLGDHTLTYLAN